MTRLSLKLFILLQFEIFFSSDQSFKCYSPLGGQPLLWFWTRFAAVDETQRVLGHSQRQSHETLGGVYKKSYRQKGSSIFLINSNFSLNSFFSGPSSPLSSPLPPPHTNQVSSWTTTRVEFDLPVRISSIRVRNWFSYASAEWRSTVLFKFPKWRISRQRVRF